MTEPATPSHRRQTCRLCGSGELTLVLKLAPTPPANQFVPESERGRPQTLFPLEVFFCEGCGHVQLLDVVDPRLLFENYVYVSGTSPVFVEHFRSYAAETASRFGVPFGSLVVDIGSNDGTLLQAFKDLGYRVLGVDPAKEIAQAATARGLETLVGFFDEKIAETIVNQHGPASLITANNVFAHIDDLEGVVRGVRRLLAPDGVFVFEVSYLVDVYKKTLFDTIYHEHLDYHTVKPLVGFFERLGMRLFDAVRVQSHGGSLRAFVQHANGPRAVARSVDELIRLEHHQGLDRAATLQGFATQIDEVGREVRDLLRRLQARGKSIAGYGAPAKATTLMHHFRIGRDLIDFIVDENPLKQGLYSPGLHIPIVAPEAMYKSKPDYVLVLAWNFADSIIRKHTAYVEGGGRFIVPLPAVQIVPAPVEAVR